jgi:peptidoglycan/xylan/chitin deacetylase (PgdA/CDA1 family)
MPRLLTLMFHGVVSELPEYACFPGGRTCLLPAVHFERTIAWCAKRYRFIRASELEDFLSSSADETRVLVTFDDGLASLVDHGLPVLAAHGASALLFVTTNWVSGARTPLVFRLERDLWTRVPRSVQIWSGDRVASFELRSRRDVSSAVGRIWEFLFASPTPPLALEASQVEIDNAPWSANDVEESRDFWHPASWDELRRAVDAGTLEIGSHGVTHRPWTSLSALDLDEELTQSRRELEQRFECVVDTCSYPHGMVNDVAAAAAARVYTWSFTNVRALATAETPRERMPRVHVPSEAPFWVSGIVKRPRVSALARRVFAQFGVA